METPLVSIIIPTYNRAHLIGETLDSIVAQTYANWECIIVDDGSTDNTVDVINKYIEKDARFQYHTRPSDRPKGGNAARNYGFEMSKGKYVNWFDSDDIMLPNFLKIKIDKFQETIKLVICTGNLVYDDLKTISKIELIDSKNLYVDYVLWNLKVLTPSILFRKTFLNDKALFNQKIKRGQESELFSRLFCCINRKEWVVLNESLFLYRQHSSTKSSKNKNFYVSDYKWSQAFIFNNTLIQALKIENPKLINATYKKLMELYFLALENKDLKTATFILNNVVQNIYKTNLRVSIEIAIIGSVFLLFKRGSYMFSKRWRFFQLS